MVQSAHVAKEMNLTGLATALLVKNREVTISLIGVHI